MDRLSGLIRPPKDLVFKLNSIVKGAIARYILQVREERQLGLFDYNDVTEIEWVLEDLNSLLDGIQDGSLELKSVQNTFEYAKDILSNPSMKKISFSNSFPYPDVIISRIRDIDIEDLFQNTEGNRSNIEEIENLLTVVLGEVKERSQDIISPRDLKEYQNAVSYLERRFDEVDSNTWYVTKKGFNPVVLKFKENQDGARGSYFFSEDTQQHVIIFRMPLQLDKSSISDAFKSIDFVVKHELIHACQKQIAINRGVEEAGLPRSRRNKKFLQHKKQEEKKLKKKMKQQGVDPDLVDFHALDDIEFYTRVMDEIHEFKKFLSYQKPLNEQIRPFLRRRFFQILKTHQPNKYKKAIGLFVEQANKEYYEQNKDSKGTKRANSSSNIVSKVAMKFLQSATRDDPKMKNTGHGGLDTWFSGHGGGTKDKDKATWGDWISITPVDHTITKEDGSKKEYEAGDIVGPCGISGKKEWASVTDGGKRPLKCMPRAKAYQMPKKDRASLAQKKQEEEKKHDGQKPVNTPTFSQEAKKMLKKSDFYREVSPPDQLSSFSTGTPVGDSENPDGVDDHSALPNGDSARNIGRPSPDSPNLKYRNLDKSEANGRTPANKLDLGYVHDSGSGSARVIPYDSGFVNNSSALRKAYRVANRGGSLTSLIQQIEGGYDVGLSLLDYGDIIRLEKIVIPKDQRGLGIGSKIMKDITAWADQKGKIISLTPSKDFGGSSVSRLVRFYSQFGFKKNKGRNKDFRTQDTMIRYPSEAQKVKIAGLIRPAKSDVDLVYDAYLFLFREVMREKLWRDFDEEKLKSIARGVDVFDTSGWEDDFLNASETLNFSFEQSLFNSLKRVEGFLLPNTKKMKAFKKHKKDFKEAYILFKNSTSEELREKYHDDAYSHMLDLENLFSEINENILTWKSFEHPRLDWSGSLNKGNSSDWNDWWLTISPSKLKSISKPIELNIEKTNSKGGEHDYYQGTHLITIGFEDYRVDFKRKYLVVKHELIHAMQKEISLNKNISTGGIPVSRRNKRFLQHNKKEEEQLKQIAKKKGIDPNKISIHALDDIEFYTRIMDEIEAYKLEGYGYDRNKIRDFIGRSVFFISLKTFQSNKYRKAVGLFVEAIQKNSSIKKASRPVRIDKNKIKDLTKDAIKTIENVAKNSKEKTLSEALERKTMYGKIYLGSYLVEHNGYSQSIDIELMVKETHEAGSYTYLPDRDLHRIEIYLKDRNISSLLPPLSLFNDLKKIIAKNIYSVLIHEITHAVERIKYLPEEITFFGKGSRFDKKEIRTRKDKEKVLKKYYNNPKEIKAYLQQIADEVEEYILSKKGAITKETIADSWRLNFGKHYLGGSKTWHVVSRYLTPKNKKYIKNAVLTYLLEQAEI